MPLDKFVLLLVVVIAAAALTVWIASMVLTALAVPGVWLAFVPAALVGYVLWRVIADRIGNAEDDHYDHIEK